MKSKKTHGGPGRGQGRPNGEPTEIINFRLNKDFIKSYKGFCKHVGKKQNHIFKETIENSKEFIEYLKATNPLP